MASDTAVRSVRITAWSGLAVVVGLAWYLWGVRGLLGVAAVLAVAGFLGLLSVVPWKELGMPTRTMISRVEDGGAEVVLADGSRWKVGAADRPTVATWTATSAVTVVEGSGAWQLEHEPSGRMVAVERV